MKIIDSINTARSLKEYREASGLSIIDVAAKINTSTTSIYKWEKGKSLPTIDHLVELSGYYNCDISDLIKSRHV